LISLIFACRSRIIMIRRELPLTKARVRLSLSHRFAEDSPSCLLRLLLALSSNWVALFMRCVVFVFSFFGKFCFCLCSCFSSGCSLLFDCRFRLGPDGPNEAKQFAPQRGDDLSMVLAAAASLE